VGPIEKFIGDAVMAVWGTPLAHEDDGERSVRAALDLVDAASTRRSHRPAHNLDDDIHHRVSGGRPQGGLANAFCHQLTAGNIDHRGLDARPTNVDAQRPAAQGSVGGGTMGYSSPQDARGFAHSHERAPDRTRFGGPVAPAARATIRPVGRGGRRSRCREAGGGGVGIPSQPWWALARLLRPIRA
jgi:hypothetical protein